MKNNLFFKQTLVMVLFAGLGTAGCSKAGFITEPIYTKPSEGPFPDYGEVVAFPGAEGFGRYATGGRGGDVYRVTTLEDAGEGSLRDAVSQPGRIVVFDVAGVINLQSVLVLSSDLTILGQTAPGDGVVLYGNRISASGAKNVICRYIRVRMGRNGPSGQDAMGIASGENMIFDHVSATWGRDENFSINSSTVRNITIQNSFIGQGLQNHSCGGLMETTEENGITLFRNLYIDNKTRNPKVKGLNQFVNNVVYNWGNGTAYDMGGGSAGLSITSIEDNYFIKGPVVNWQEVRLEDGSLELQLVPMNPSRPFTGGNENFNAFFAGNFYDHDKDGTLNGVEIIPATNWEEYCSGNPVFLSSRPDVFPAIAMQTNAEEAYAWIVENGGASLPARDQVDNYLIEELTSLGTKGTIIQNERDTQQFPLGGVGEIKTGEKPLDSDEDGIPDSFEDEYDLDKNDPTDATKLASNGYMNIENYAFSIGAIK
jgi:hypothetical protein